MDYNIHLHLPDGSNAQTSANSGSIAETPRSRLGTWYESFLDRINQCYNWRSLYELAEDFHKIGLTIHNTSDGKRVLCRLEDGKPVTSKIIDDYVFAGSSLAIDEEVSTRAMEVIRHFVETNASEPQKLVTDSQTYSRNTSLYGDQLSLYQNTRPKHVSSPHTRPVQETTHDHEVDILNQEIELISRLLES